MTELLHGITLRLGMVYLLTVSLILCLIIPRTIAVGLFTQWREGDMPNLDGFKEFAVQPPEPFDE